MRFVSVSLALVLLVSFGCKNRSNNPGVSPDVKAPESSAAKTQASIDMFEKGFEVTSKQKCAPGSADCKFAAEANIATQSILDRTRDLQQVGRYTVFAWPKTLPNRDYDALGVQMTQYGGFVGTALHVANPQGPAQISWVKYKRQEQINRYYSKIFATRNEFCGTVVEQLVDNLLPEGSDYRQYGNCGEGGLIGACLASKAGFEEKEIRICQSRNDHFFAMVKHPTRSWCILDRWNLVNGKNFECDVDWDSAKQIITWKGETTGQSWFKRTTCTTMAEFRLMGGSMRYLPDLPGAIPE